MLDQNLLAQVKTYFEALSSKYTFVLTYNKNKGEDHQELFQFLTAFASTSDKINLVTKDGDNLAFELLKDGEETGICFQGIPGGHEFTSLLLAVLNADGKGKNIPDLPTLNRIKALQKEVHLKSFVSLSCTNCPDVVQALNLVALYNKKVKHTIIIGEHNEELVKSYNVQAVPTVLADEKSFHVGRGELGGLLVKLENLLGSVPSTEEIKHSFDVLVFGGGPAGVSAAIYAARKGLNVGIVAENIGGQVKETVAIENLISVPKTTGAELAQALRKHASEYPITILENRRIIEADLTNKNKQLKAVGNEVFEAPALIIATGAKWRKLNVPGENDYIGKGVAFCPHCDGPLFKNKHVAVIGGGNSGIEAAIDLAGICAKVTVVEFLTELKADKVLQDKARSLDNVEILLNTQTVSVEGDGTKLTGITLKDRATEQIKAYSLDGVFVQIGLAANTEVFKDKLEMNRLGEIIIDERCRTSVKGVYAAGDSSSVPYNQIIIAMGEGAKASLTAFEDRMRGEI